MKKVWVRFWKKSGANMNLSETWRLYEDDYCKHEENLRSDAEDWSDTVGGGFGSGRWKYGFEYNCPPSEEWLDKRIKGIRYTIKELNAEIEELSELKA